MNPELESKLRSVVTHASLLRNLIGYFETDLASLNRIGFSDGRTWSVPDHWNELQVELRVAVGEILSRRIEALKAEYDQLEVPEDKQ